MRAEILAGLATATALALSITVGAQGGAPKEHTMSGCLQKGSEAGTFVVMNTAEKGPKTIGITAESTVADLTKHVGRQDRHHRGWRAERGSGERRNEAGEGGSLHENHGHEARLPDVSLEARGWSWLETKAGE